jgi:rhodanese-related sulfurtransferase
MDELYRNGGVKMKKIQILGLIIISMFVLIACTRKEEINMTYQMITMEEAKTIFETEGDYVILDVRRMDEFESGHIPNAVNVPNEVIGDEKIEELPDKDQRIYVYRRSGNRSKQAAEKLVQLGYTNIIEFGGILDWTGEVETGAK